MPAFVSIYLAHPGSRAIHRREGAGSTAVVIQRTGLLCRRLASASPGIVLVLSGRKILHSRGRDFVIGAGEAVLIPDRLDFDVLKVDRAFTRQLGKTDQGNVFFEAIITMAHALGMRVVAEGVERREQVAILRSLGCDEIQGFIVSKPLAPTTHQADLFRALMPAPA